MRRPQFSLKSLLWLMAVVAAFCAGAVWHRAAAHKEVERLTLQMKSMGESNISAYKKLRELSRIIKATPEQGDSATQE